MRVSYAAQSNTPRIDPLHKNQFMAPPLQRNQYPGNSHGSPQLFQLTNEAAVTPGARCAPPVIVERKQIASAIRYQDAAPVKVLSPEHFALAAAVLKANTKQLKHANCAQSAPDESNGLRDQGAPRTEEEQWNDRLDDTLEMLHGTDDVEDTDTAIATLSRVVADAHDHSSDPRMRVAYFFDNVPVALAELKKKTNTKPLRIVAVASHPLSKNAGGALLEIAVNESLTNGDGGKVRLKYLNSDAKCAYESMGFRAEPTVPWMSLDPGNSDKWVKRDGTWRLSRYKDMRYAAGFLPKPPSSFE